MTPRTAEYRCLQCDRLTTQPNRRDLLACGECSTVFTRRRARGGHGNSCPKCANFGNKIAGIACPHCENGELVEARRILCMICNAEHYRDRIPVRCFGDGDGPRGSIVTTQASPTGRDDESLPLPVNMTIREMRHWIERNHETGETWRFKQWITEPRHPRSKAEVRITAIWQPDGTAHIQHECRYCARPEEAASMDEILTKIAQGAHRHGLVGVATAAPNETVTGPEPIWPGDEFAQRVETIPWEKPEWPEREET